MVNLAGSFTLSESVCWSVGSTVVLAFQFPGYVLVQGHHVAVVGVGAGEFDGFLGGETLQEYVRLQCLRHKPQFHVMQS